MILVRRGERVAASSANPACCTRVELTKKGRISDSVVVTRTDRDPEIRTGRCLFRSHRDCFTRTTHRSAPALALHQSAVGNLGILGSGVAGLIPAKGLTQRSVANGGPISGHTGEQGSDVGFGWHGATVMALWILASGPRPAGKLAHGA